MGKTYMLYARVSPHGSTNTSQETSINAQLEECRRYVLERDRDAQFLEEVATPPWAGRRGRKTTRGARNASVEPLGSEND